MSASSGFGKLEIPALKLEEFDKLFRLYSYLYASPIELIEWERLLEETANFIGADYCDLSIDQGAILVSHSEGNKSSDQLKTSSVGKRSIYGGLSGEIQFSKNYTPVSDMKDTLKIECLQGFYAVVLEMYQNKIELDMFESLGENQGFVSVLLDEQGRLISSESVLEDWKSNKVIEIRDGKIALLSTGEALFESVFEPKK